MGNYFFLAPSLSPLSLDEKPDLSFDDLIHRFDMNLSRSDSLKVKAVRRMIDFLNIRSHFLGAKFDSRGNLSERDFDDALLAQSDLPDYFFQFLDKYKENEERLRYFFALFSDFLSDEISTQSGFLKTFFVFERQWRLVMLAIRSKQQKRALEFALQFEDPTDPLVAQILSQRDAPTYTPPPEFFDLKDRYVACGPDPWELYLSLREWRFKKIAEMSYRFPFSIDWILGYFIQYLIVDDGFRLDKQAGAELLEKIVVGKG